MWNKIKEHYTIAGFALIFFIVVAAFQLSNSSFLSAGSIINMMKTVSPIAIAALGLTFVVIVGYSDISFYMSSCFSAMFMAWLISKGVHPVLAILGGLLAGVFWGSISGVAVGKFRLPDLISTIAIGSIAFGAAYIFSNGTFIYENFLNSGISNLSEFRIIGVPLPVYIMLFIFGVAYILLEKSEVGRNLYAIGANKKATYLSGVNIVKYIIFTFIVCSVLASVSTMISTAAQGNGNVKIGLNLLMPSFTSIYIGWSVFKKPCVIGTLLGALLTTVMTNGFIVVNVPYYVGDLIIAAVLIISILISKVDLDDLFHKREKVKSNG